MELDYYLYNQSSETILLSLSDFRPENWDFWRLSWRWYIFAYEIEYSIIIWLPSLNLLQNLQNTLDYHFIAQMQAAVWHKTNIFLPIFPRQAVSPQW